MEELGGAAATRLRHQRNRPSSDRLLGTFEPRSSAPSTPPLELSEHDIFSTPSGSSSPSPTHPVFTPNSNRSAQSHNRGHYGILAALNENLKTRSGPETRPVFNHKASTSASLSSSTSTSPAASASSRIMTIPKRPPPPPLETMRLRLQSAPLNVPADLMRRARDLGDAISEEDDEEEVEEKDGVRLPPHEIVAARDLRESPLLACSVLEGAGRTLKGRDLRQVRNAIWRKTGFID